MSFKFLYHWIFEREIKIISKFLKMYRPKNEESKIRAFSFIILKSYILECIHRIEEANTKPERKYKTTWRKKKKVNNSRSRSDAASHNCSLPTLIFIRGVPRMFQPRHNPLCISFGLLAQNVEAPGPL